MRTIIDLDIDQELLARAKELAGIDDEEALLEPALEALVARECARRSPMLGMNEPGSGAPPSGGPVSGAD